MNYVLAPKASNQVRDRDEVGQSDALPAKDVMLLHRKTWRQKRVVARVGALCLGVNGYM